MLPKIIKDAILSIDGRGYAGRIRNLSFPKLSRKMEEYRAGGMDGAVKVDLGGEALNMEFEMDEHSSELLRSWGAGISALKFRINASAESDELNGSEAIEVIALGRFSEIELGKYEPGQLSSSKYTVELSAFSYRLNGVELIEMDYLNYIYKVNGVDLFSERRRNLKL